MQIIFSLHKKSKLFEGEIKRVEMYKDKDKWYEMYDIETNAKDCDHHMIHHICKVEEAEEMD